MLFISGGGICPRVDYHYLIKRSRTKSRFTNYRTKFTLDRGPKINSFTTFDRFQLEKRSILILQVSEFFFTRINVKKSNLCIGRLSQGSHSDNTEFTYTLKLPAPIVDKSK